MALRFSTRPIGTVVSPVIICPPGRTTMHLASKTLIVGLICAASAGAADMKKAARDWKSKCASCHGADGKAHTDQGKKMKIADLSSASWQKANTDAKIKEVIENG